MEKQKLINASVLKMNKLSEDKLQEVDDFIEFLLNKTENETLNLGIQMLCEKSSAFDHLKEDEDLYSISDLKENLFEKGNLVCMLVSFTDFLGRKNRPAFVLINTLEDASVSFLTN